MNYTHYLLLSADPIAPEKLLKYGFPGIVVIFALLLFYLFRGQFRNTMSTRDFLIKISPFIAITLVLLVMSGFAIYTDKQFEKDKSTAGQNHTIDSLKTQLLIFQGKSPETEGLQHRFDQIKHKKDSLEQLIEALQTDQTARDNYLKDYLMAGIVDSFEDILDHTGSHATVDPTNANGVNDRILRNDIFQNIIRFGADTAVLRQALLSLQKRGFNFHLSQILAGAPELLVLRRQWLKTAIQQLNNKIEHSPQAQSDVYIDISLPKAVWMIDQPYTAHLTENQLETLISEKKMLDNKLLK